MLNTAPRSVLVFCVSLLVSCHSWAMQGAADAQESGQLDKVNENTARQFFGTVSSENKAVAGAMVSFLRGKPSHSITVFSDDEGRYVSPGLDFADGYSLRVRRAGWRDVLLHDKKVAVGGSRQDIEMQRVRDPAELAEQLPGSYWYQLVLERLDSDQERFEFKQQCTYCHQQGSEHTRGQRSREQWRDIVMAMGRRGAILTTKLREKLPDVFIAAYHPDNAIARLADLDGSNGPLPVPSQAARQAIIEEWELGGAHSHQHDLIVYPGDGTIWSVDGPMDMLHQLDLRQNSQGERRSWKIPRGNHQIGGVYHNMGDEPEPVATYVSPHSLQVAPDGRIWLTLAKGNQLAGFDPVSESWEIVDLQTGINPHTLRFDKKGRLWYTITATNHVGMFNPLTKEHRYVSLPTRDWQTTIILRLTPFLVSIGKWLNIRERSSKADGVSMPMPYGIDIAPDGGVWYSQLNDSRIGRIDPQTFAVSVVETPFVTPRRLRFDSEGGLWIPSYSQSVLAHYDLQSGTFTTWNIPIEPQGSGIPYALNIVPDKGEVWITGTNSDAMIRFQTDTEQFTFYPLPTRVTYTRELDFDAHNRVWTSHSNGPAWHVEGGIPKLTRIDPEAAPNPQTSGFFKSVGLSGR